MDNSIDLRQLNNVCRKYLLGKLPIPEELELKERLGRDRPYRLWFNWLLLKWLKTAWLKKNSSFKMKY